ncbi:hypothetical protein L195_g063573 [Trifolium pratense]|uniref:Uncharacterized protein n=1 Tax=Trifolium pratense TaxID=57577 RepID=A0A2K3KMM0_TRIPR|nr:hypothetical protein L195_g063573 [Trifolium pratense]
MEDVSGSRGVVVSCVGSSLWDGAREIARWRAARVLVVARDSEHSGWCWRVGGRLVQGACC